MMFSSRTSLSVMNPRESYPKRSRSIKRNASVEASGGRTDGVTLSARSVNHSCAFAAYDRRGEEATGSRGPRSRNELAAQVEAPVVDVSLVPEPVRLTLPGTDQVRDLVPAREQEFRDQAPVTAPPHRLGAHEARRRPPQRALARLLPRRLPHPRRVAPERRHAQAGEPLRARLAAPPSAQLFGVTVRDSGRVQARSQRVAAELRVPPRGRKPPHVDERPDARLEQALDEFLRRPRPVADRERAHRHRIAALRQGRLAWRRR